MAGEKRRHKDRTRLGSADRLGKKASKRERKEKTAGGSKEAADRLRKRKGERSNDRDSSDEGRRQKSARSAGRERKGPKRAKMDKSLMSSDERSEDSVETQSGESGSGESSLDSEESEAEVSSSSSSGGRKKRRKKRVRTGMWELVNEMWPLDTRPKLLQSKKTVEKMTIAEVSQFKEHYEKEEEKKGAGSAVYGKDRKLKPVNFEKGKDDGVARLHPARFELRMPLCAPKKYWSKMPVRREVYRHFPLAHLGMEGQVSEATIVRMHDRRVPITLDMLYKGNAARDVKAEKAEWLEPTEIKHLQEAILNYVVLLHALWPVDYAGMVITRVLVEANWGIAAGGNEKARVALVRKFFDDTVRDNSGRAARREPPLSYEEAKAKWTRVVENVLPGWGALGAAAAAHSSGKVKQAAGQQQQAKRGGAGGSGGRGNELLYILI